MLTKKQVEHIAKLAFLSLNLQEKNIFRRQLTEILKHIEILKEVKTEKINPTSQVTELENVFRTDKKEKSFVFGEILRGAKNKYKNFFKVKVILKEK